MQMHWEFQAEASNPKTPLSIVADQSELDLQTESSISEVSYWVALGRLTARRRHARFGGMETRVPAACG